jgi:hypothetical protein
MKLATLSSLILVGISIADLSRVFRKNNSPNRSGQGNCLYYKAKTSGYNTPRNVPNAEITG